MKACNPLYSFSTLKLNNSSSKAMGCQSVCFPNSEVAEPTLYGTNGLKSLLKQ